MGKKKDHSRRDGTGNFWRHKSLFEKPEKKQQAKNEKYTFERIYGIPDPRLHASPSVYPNVPNVTGSDMNDINDISKTLEDNWMEVEEEEEEEEDRNLNSGDGFAARMATAIASLSRTEPKEAGAATRRRNANFVRNWETIVPYIATGLQMRCNNFERRPCNCIDIEERSITTISLGKMTKLAFNSCICMHWATVLAALGFFPGSPAHAEMGFDVDLLDHYITAVNIGGVSKEAYSEGLRLQLQKKHVTPIPKFGANFRDATYWYSVAQELAFGINNATVALDQLCPACFGGARQSAVVCLDGNFQHSRLANVARFAVDPSEEDCRIFLPNLPSSAQATEKMKNVRNNPGGCLNSFKADSGRSKSKNLEETGIMLAACKHDIPLRAVNFVRSGETYEHPIALLRSILAEASCPARLLVYYDVACRFKVSAKKRLATEMFERCEFIIPSFHIYAHRFACQVAYHQRTIPSSGLAEGESCERVWSQIRHLVVPNRYSSPAVRRRSLTNVFLAIGDRKKAQMYAIFKKGGLDARDAKRRAEDVLSNVVGQKTVALDGEAILVSLEFLDEQAKLAIKFYAQSGVHPKVPAGKDIYDALENRRSVDAAYRLIDEAGDDRADWSIGTGGKWIECHKQILERKALMAQRDLWAHLSSKKKNTEDLLSGPSGTRGAGVSIVNLKNLGNKIVELVGDYNSRAQAYNLFSGRYLLRSIDINDANALDDESPMWDLDKAIPGTAWSKDKMVFNWIKGRQLQLCAITELSMLKLEEQNFDRYMLQCIQSTHDKLVTVGPDCVGLASILKIRHDRLVLLYKKEVDEDFEPQEQWIEALSTAIVAEEESVEGGQELDPLEETLSD
ncbi:hypothetical protein H0X32_04430 [Patescibacteria group bacterium]|nr:hypothetical protein [Patescibacteria group bacterium]